MGDRRNLILVAVFALALGAFAVTTLLHDEEPLPSSVRVVLASDVEWQALNPLRGDKSPRAGTLWGSRSTPVPSGFLVKFVDGFSSPPHIHPVTYRGVVVSGLVHNDVPDAEEVWLPPGSFWTQPAGEVHITAAKGTENVAYIEIEKGPYLVHPAKDAFERPETPIKMDPASMAWADAPGSGLVPSIAKLAGNPQDEQLTRSLVRLQAGFSGTLQSDVPALHAVVIQGRLEHHVPEKSDAQTLEPGSYFGSEGKVTHRVSCTEADCLIYVRTKGTFSVASASQD
ncbi:MAG: DUF4437 domain-containing protein [Planctomycetota bacterium]|nr:DUF4437 domain-containing protein [Planctomycetota bacterium]